VAASALAVVLALVLFAVGWSALAVWRGHDRVDRMLAVRDELQIPEGWTYKGEEVVGYSIWGTYCNFGINRCPRMSMGFEAAELVDSIEELEALLPEATWEVGKADCKNSYGSTGSAIRCYASSKWKGFRVSAELWGAAWQPDVEPLPGGRVVSVTIRIDE
jgi:hypothetical protein